MSTAIGLLREFRAGALSPVEVAAEVNARVEAVDPAVHAVRTPTADRAAAQAEESLRRYRAGTARPLEGVPYVVKDLFDTAGVPTSYGSRLFDGHVPDRDAAAVARVRAAGAVLIGKVTTHEFGWGYTTGSEHWEPTRNPWSLDRIPGGSSGGSAAALAAGLAPLALGSDTGGSVRVPSAFCGVTGFKPTFGRVDAAGAFPLAPTLDHVGPMARDPADAALLFTVLADLAGELPGGDVEAWVASLRRAQEDPGHRPLAGMTVGVLADPGRPVPVPAVLGAVASAADRLAALGASVVPVDPPGGSTPFEVFTPILLGEALAIHRERGLLPARRTEYGSDVQARIAMAEALDPAEVAGARARRRRLREQLGELFTEVDLLLGPVAAGPPPKVGEKLVPHDGELVEMRRLLHPWVAAQNLAGLPACALPGGFDDADLPVGIQITGRPGADTRVLEAAAALYGSVTEPPRWPAI